MASAKLTKCAIYFLIILHYSFVNAHESISGRRTKFAVEISYEDDALVHKKGDYGGDHKRMRGSRKMLERVEEELNKRSEGKKLDGSSHEPNISGSIATTERFFHGVFPPAVEVSTKSKVDNQDAKNINDDESEEISEAADEVVNMMRKDYKGPDRIRHKPPINNHNPTDWP